MLVFLYIALVVWRVFDLIEQDKTDLVVAEIHAKRLTLADVEGKNLPPVPNKEKNDATIEGIDANNNGIRDDVELAIFEKYPSDKKTRAAALQYAMELQMEFTKVFNSETLVAVIQEQSRGFSCAYGSEDSVEELVFNTEERKKFSEVLREKYATSYALPNTQNCDIIF